MGTFIRKSNKRSFVLGSFLNCAIKASLKKHQAMRTILLFYLLFFFAGVSCKKEKEDLYWGYINTQSNGINWSAKVRAARIIHFVDKFDILFEKYNNKILIELLGFSTIPMSTGRYRIFKKDFTIQDPLKATSNFYTLSDDGDVICDVYHVVEADSVSNYIEIESYSQSNNEVRGRFAVKLSVGLPKCFAAAPDSITFLNGNFHAKIK